MSVTFDFIIGIIEMIFSNTAVRFSVLLVVAKISETWCYDPVAPSMNNRNRLIQNNFLSLFNNEGFIDIDGTNIARGIGGNRKFVTGTYNSSHDQLKTLMNVRVETDDDPDFDVDDKSYDGDWIEEYLENLEILNLESSNLYNLTASKPKWLSSTTVKILILRSAYIGYVAEDVLTSVRETLELLDLTNASISINDIVTLMKSLSQDENEPGLKMLCLGKLHLTTIPYDVLEVVQYSLMALSLFGNDFGTVEETMAIEESESTSIYGSDYHWDSELESFRTTDMNYLSGLLNVRNKSSGSSWARFPPMPFLVILDLRECKINSIEEDTFQSLRNLKYLLLSNNGIFTVANYAFDGLGNLIHLDLSFNHNTSNERKYAGLKISQYAFEGLRSLTTLNLSYTFLRASTSDYLRGLPSSLVTLDLHKTGLTTLGDGIFEKLNNLQFLDISDNIGLCSDVTKESFVGLEMLQELHITRTSLRDLGVLRDLSLLKYLDMKHNNLITFVNELENFPLLEHFDVGHNYIGSWSNGRAFASNRWLKSVFLHDNFLSLMTNDMVKDFKSLSYLTLANNSFVCNCPLKEFMEYYKDVNNEIGVDIPLILAYDSDYAIHNCTDLTLSQTFHFEDTDKYCIDETTIIRLSTIQHIVYIAILILICCTSFGTLVYWKWWYIRYVAVLLKNATVLSIINVENCEDRIYIYDIFVSYSDANRNWIFEELIPNIEGPDLDLNICMHERDFQVGVSILENIITGMDQSRTILLVISSFFIKSQWCQFEMHMAQHRLIETCREELILIFLEEIPKGNRSKILRYLMMVKTYIVWPKECEGDQAKQLFWKRLRKAITLNKSKPNLLPQ